MFFFLHRDRSFCFMIHRRSTVYLRPRDKYLQFFLHREILQVLDTSRRKEKASISYKKVMNVSTGTSANSTSSSYTPTSVLSRVEGITVSAFFLLETVLIVTGNFLTISLFATERKLRKKNLFLVVNMAFADLISGAVSLPLYVYLYIGPAYRLWKWHTSYTTLHICWDITDTTFSQASLIPAVFIALERFYAIYWPLKHRTLSPKAYYITIVIIWTLALLVSAVFNPVKYLISEKAATYAWMSFPLLFLFIVCACNIGICRTFHKRKVSSQQGNRASQTRRLTVTLLLVSTISLLSWLPLVTANYIFYVQNINTSKWHLIYRIINILNFSNCFVNSVLYSLRIPEFRQALALCFTRCQKVINRPGGHEERDNRSFALTPLPNNSRSLQQDFELKPVDTKV